MFFTRTKQWTVDQYHRMIAAEILTENDRVELLYGQIIEINPQLSPHASTTQRANAVDWCLSIGFVVLMPVTGNIHAAADPNAIVLHDIV